MDHTPFPIPWQEGNDIISSSESTPFSLPHFRSDLDGDTFFVCWDQTIMPPAEVKPAPPAKAANGGKKKHSREWDIRDLNEVLIEAFVQLRGDRLLTRASNEWKRVAERVPELTKGEYPLALADIVEVALVGTAVFYLPAPFTSSLTSSSLLA